jgi:NADPH-dependent curcumin reductase CurA
MVESFAQRAFGLGTVMSDGKTLRKGDKIVGTFGWTEYIIVKESVPRKVKFVFFVKREIHYLMVYYPAFSPPPGADAIDYLGALGMIGT